MVDLGSESRQKPLLGPKSPKVREKVYRRNFYIYESLYFTFVFTRGSHERSRESYTEVDQGYQILPTPGQVGWVLEQSPAGRVERRRSS